MSLHGNLVLSGLYERAKTHRGEYAAEHSGAHTMGYLAGVDACLKMMEEEAANATPAYLRRPTKPTYEFDSEGSD